MRHASAPLVPIDAVGKLDQSLLFTGAGMVQFKPYFRGLATPPSLRLVTSQKCVRAKDIEEVGNPAHLTFFEMLGNFSFGDYFKESAVDFAWEFLTSKEWLALDPNLLCVTVFEEDDEAYGFWAEKWRAAGFDPEQRIHRLGEASNYWPAGALSAGPPGPCGPCSEIFFRTAAESELSGDFATDEAAGKWLEIWNLVFMQYEWAGVLKDETQPHLGYIKTGMDPLPQKNIDTGMGLERTARVLGNFASVYETDVFSPIVAAIAERAGCTYGTSDEKDRAMRVIADHIRTASFCIADGIIPSNTGRGYVLRRLIRRSILKGTRTLGIDGPFLAGLLDAVVEALGDPYIELSERADAIKGALALEESAFLKTMRQGHERFGEMLAQNGSVDGRDAFFLYDTFGFPFEVTQELAQEAGMSIDEVEFQAALKEAQEKSRSARGADEVFAGSSEAIVLATALDAPPTSEFVGYDRTTHVSRIVQISPRFGQDGKTTGDFQICLEETPFYAESGGQVGDCGRIQSDDFEFSVSNTWKEMGLIWHDAKLERFDQSLVGLSSEAVGAVLQSGVFFASVLAVVDARRRLAIMRNHTATHLLHAALREHLGTHVTQAGSLVAPDRLRFDFTHGKALTHEEVRAVEESVNERISEGLPVRIHWNVPIAEARKLGAMMLFGEKYGDFVRVVDVPGASVELCGGTHVGNIAEIGLFKIMTEASSAGGVRRIEAVTGYGAFQVSQQQSEMLREIAGTLKTQPAEIPGALARLQAKAREAKKNAPAGPETGSQTRQAGRFTLKFAVVPDGTREQAKALVDRWVEADSAIVALVAFTSNGSVNFFCKVGKDALAQGADAGPVVKAAAAVAGGGGGGTPEFAQAGGKDQDKAEDAVAAAVAKLSEM